MSRIKQTPLDPAKGRRESGRSVGCSRDGCDREGTYPAPAGRHEGDGRGWFCLEHVRRYNCSWDYFAGMTESEIEFHRRDDTVGRRALAALDLDPPAGPAAIRGRYRELVKKHHPDANGGDKRAEERLKSITAAYAHLTACGYL